MPKSSYFFNSGFFNNKWSSNITEIFGVIPYEIYEKVGMYSSILQVLWLSTPNPFQFYLVPYWFTFTIIRILKEIIPRKRPGCFHKDMNTFIDKTIEYFSNNGKLLHGGNACVFVDVDNDGYSDLYISTEIVGSPSYWATVSFRLIYSFHTLFDS